MFDRLRKYLFGCPRREQVGQMEIAFPSDAIDWQGVVDQQYSRIADELDRIADETDELDTESRLRMSAQDIRELSGDDENVR